MYKFINKHANVILIIAFILGLIAFVVDRYVYHSTQLSLKEQFEYQEKTKFKQDSIYNAKGIEYRDSLINNIKSCY